MHVLPITEEAVHQYLTLAWKMSQKIAVDQLPLCAMRTYSGHHNSNRDQNHSTQYSNYSL